MHPLDIALILGFLAANIIAGFWYRGQRQTFQEYAIGDKKFSTPVLTATIVATWMSGSVFFLCLENSYTQGLYYIIASLGLPMALLIIGFLIGPRMGDFFNNVSVPHILGDYYGPNVQAMAGISVILHTVGFIAVQFKVISKITEILFGYTGAEVTIATATLVILYSSCGGVRAVTFTDVVQFFTFGILFPALALAIWSSMEAAPLQVVAVLSKDPRFNFQEVVQWTPAFRATLVLMGYYMLPTLPTGLFQRIAMARDVKQVQESFMWAAFLCLAVILCLVWVSFLLLSDQPGLEPEELVPYLARTYAYPGFKGLLGIGVIAMAMSTADSYLHSCAVVVTNDVVPRLVPNYKVSLGAARIATLGVGLLALLLALQLQDLLNTILLSASFYAPIVVVPLLLTLFGFRTSKRVVLLTMGAGLVTVVGYLLYSKNENSFFIGMFTNLVVMLGAHYALGEPGGWQPIAPDSPLALERLARKLAWQRRIQAIKAFRLYPYLQQNLPKQSTFYPVFGLYILAATYAPLYTLAPALREQYHVLYQLSCLSTLGISTTFITYPIWPPRWQNEQLLTWLWPAVSFYSLFYVPSLLVIISNFHQAQLMGLMLNVVIAVLSLHWALALMMALSGTILALYTVQWTMGVAMLPGEWTLLQFTFLYFYSILLLFVSVFMAMRYRNTTTQLAVRNTYLMAQQQALWQQLLQTFYRRERFIQEMTTEGAEALQTVTKLSHTLAQQVAQIEASSVPPSLSKAQNTLQQANQKLTLVGNHLYEMMARVQDYLPLEISTFRIETLLESVEQALAQQGLTPAPQVIYQVTTQHKELQGDVNQLRGLLVRSIGYVHEHHPAKYVLLGIQDTTLGYRLSAIQGYTKKVAALCWTVTPESKVAPCEALYMGSVEQPATRLAPSLLALAPNHQIVDAHYGVAELLAGEQGLTQTYVIPVRVREVRPQAMESLSAVEPHPDKTVHPAEQAFVAAVASKTNISLSVLEKAIELLKQHHGGVSRKHGTPSYLHAMAVAHILLDYSQEEDVVLAALLYETVENTWLSLNQIALFFNPNVQQLIAGVMRLDGNLRSFKHVQLSEDESMMRLLAVEDKRILYVKLAARLHTMRNMEDHMSYTEQKQLTSETLQFFVLLAERLGFKETAEELKALCLQGLRRGQ